MSRFFCERIIKATTVSRRCEACWLVMPVGSRVMRWIGTDDDFGVTWRHPECARAEQDFNRRAALDTRDEWWSLTEVMECSEPADLRWLIEAHPVVADRLDVEPQLARMMMEGKD